ncbi:MAG TPA: Rieske (2Fe-2S) protein [Streptosporangiaceae bacterium]|nr:Rieske (2Fe-2S) protein [Streptosporangiaceae bacterium]
MVTGLLRIARPRCVPRGPGVQRGMEVADGTIDCPCHGSEFTITDGAVVTGPASAPLPARRIEVADGTVILL